MLPSQLSTVTFEGLDKNYGQRNVPLPGAGASWRAELPAVLTSEAVEASSWLGYFATVPATVENEQRSLVKSRNVKM